MPDNQSDIEDPDNLSSDDGELRSVGSSPSGTGFKSMIRNLTDQSSPPSILSSVQGSSPCEVGLNGSSPPNSISSVQSAFAALAAVQMSLNQVTNLTNPNKSYLI